MFILDDLQQLGQSKLQRTGRGNLIVPSQLVVKCSDVVEEHAASGCLSDFCGH